MNETLSPSQTASPTRTWIFQANPKIYDIDAALASLHEMSWSINQYKQSINPGDAVFVWRSGAGAGIVAEATVLSGPAMMDQDGIQFALQADKFDKQALRAGLRIDKVYPAPLPRDILIARLPDLSIIQSPQGTNFAVTPEEALVIREMLAAQDEDKDEISDVTEGESGGSLRVWAYAPGPKAQFWEEFYREGIMAIGWDELGDLSQYRDHATIAKKLIEAYKMKGFPINDSRACFDFLHSIKLGDRIIAKRGRDEVVGYGTDRRI